MNDLVKDVLQKTKETQTARVGMVDWVVSAVGVQIQGLRASQTGRAHDDWIDLGETALLWVVVAVEGVIEAGVQTAVVMLIVLVQYLSCFFG